MTFRKIADVGVLVGIGIFIGLMIADTSTAEHHLRQWQTLIAGILAVIAAAWTVGEMRKQDQSQQARHEELMRLNLRADRLRARRAAFPHAIKIASVGETLTAYEVDSFDEFATLTDKQTAISMMAQCQRHMHNLLNEQSIIDAKDMFGSDMAHTFKFLLERFDMAENYYADANRFARFGEHSAWDITNVKNFYRQMALLSKPLKQFSEQLLTLAYHYGPD